MICLPKPWPPKEPGVYTRKTMAGWETVWITDSEPCKFELFRSFVTYFAEPTLTKHEFRP